MLIIDWREWNVTEFSCFQPMDQSCVNGHTFFCRNVWTILQIIMLSLLLRFEVQSRQSSQVLLAYCLVNCCSSFYSFSVVICGVRPPVSFLLHVSQNHVLNWSRHTWNFPRDVSFPTSPCLSKMLHNCLCFICFYTFWHHIHNIFHDCSSELQIIMRLGSLFSDDFYQTF